MSRIPPHYASMFANVQPRKAEEISKPLDEKLMALIDKEEDAPLVIQKIDLIENKPEEKEEVEIEEISEEVTEDVKVEEIDKEEVENEDMEVRKRHVKDEE